MDEAQAKALGRLIRTKRKELGYSTRELAQAAAVGHSTVVRFEQGHFTAPRPDKLARFAELLEVPVADLYARAGYLVPDDLPDFEAYLHARYPQLPARAVTQLNDQLAQIARRYAIPLDNPEPPAKEPSDDTNRRPAA